MSNQGSYKFQNNEDSYSFIELLIKELEGIGKTEEAENLWFALRTSSVLTEVFMKLRSALVNTIDDNPPLKTETINKIKDAIDDLNLAFR